MKDDVTFACARQSISTTHVSKGNVVDFAAFKPEPTHATAAFRAKGSGEHATIAVLMPHSDPIVEDEATPLPLVHGWIGELGAHQHRALRSIALGAQGVQRGLLIHRNRDVPLQVGWPTRTRALELAHAASFIDVTLLERRAGTRRSKPTASIRAPRTFHENRALVGLYVTARMADLSSIHRSSP